MTFDAAEKLPIFTAPVGVAAQLVLEVLEVDAALGVLADGDDLGDRLAPRQLVRVVLVGPDEDHRPLAAASSSQQADELVDGPGRAGAAEHDDVVGGRRYRRVDDGAGLLAQLGRSPAGGRRLGVGVGVHRQDLLADEVLDEAQ